MSVTPEQGARINAVIARARDLGHYAEAAPTSTGKRWMLRCSCGWGELLADGRPTVTRATELEAMRTLWHHVRTSVEKHDAANRVNGGVSRRRAVGAGL